MKKRFWATLFLLLVGAIVYCYKDLQSAYPVWFNWLFAGIALTAFVHLTGRYQKALHPLISGYIGCALLASLGLPLVANVSDAAFKRDNQRVYPGMSRAALFQQMAPYTRFKFFYRDGMEIHEFRKAVYHDGYYLRGIFTLHNGKVIEKSLSVHDVTPTDYWVYPNMTR